MDVSSLSVRTKIISRCSKIFQFLIGCFSKCNFVYLAPREDDRYPLYDNTIGNTFLQRCKMDELCYLLSCTWSAFIRISFFPLILIFWYKLELTYRFVVCTRLICVTISSKFYRHHDFRWNHWGAFAVSVYLFRAQH